MCQVCRHFFWPLRKRIEIKDALYTKKGTSNILGQVWPLDHTSDTCMKRIEEQQTHFQVQLYLISMFMGTVSTVLFSVNPKFVFALTKQRRNILPGF